MALERRCSRCGGLTHLDAGDGELGPAPSQVCWQCGDRVELNLDGTPLAVIQPIHRAHPQEQTIRVMYAQGMSVNKIVGELHCGRQLVLEVLLEAGELRTKGLRASR